MSVDRHDALFSAFLKGLVDGGAVSEGPAGHPCQGEPEAFLVEPVGPSVGGCGRVTGRRPSIGRRGQVPAADFRKAERGMVKPRGYFELMP